jgi:hypothetical protein
VRRLEDARLARQDVVQRMDGRLAIVRRPLLRVGPVGKLSGIH